MGSNYDRRDFLRLLALSGVSCVGPSLLERPLWAQAASSTVTFASTPGGAVSYSFELTEQLGIGRKHGIDFRVKRITSPPDAENSVVLGTTDGYSWSPVSAIRANRQGHKIRLIGPSILLHTSLLVRTDSPYRRLEELKGKKIATLSKVTGAYTGFAALGRMMGFDIDKDFQLVLTGSGPAMRALLQRKDVEAITMFESFTSVMVAGNEARVLLDFNKAWVDVTKTPGFTALGLAVRQQWIDENPARAKAVSTTVLETLRAFHNDPDKYLTTPFAEDFLGVKTPEAKKLLRARLLELYPTEWTEGIVQAGRLFTEKSSELGLLEGARATRQEIDAVFPKEFIQR